LIHAQRERERMTMDGRHWGRGATATALTGALTLLAVAPSAEANDVIPWVRFLHAVPGAGPADLAVAGRSALAREDFGGLSAYKDVPTGHVEFTLAAKPGGKPIATHATDLTGGRCYTVYAVSQGGKVTLNVLRDAARREPAARLRVVHVAPELGKPDLWLAGRALARHVPYMATTGYVGTSAGSEKLAVAAPGHSSDPIVSRTLDVASGQTMTAFVVGSKGKRVRIVTGHDARVAASKLTYVVRHGDNLWSIARRQLGGTADAQRIAQRMRGIWNANAAHIPSGDPDLIRPGQRLTLS
jgi:hypothetical protein